MNIRAAKLDLMSYFLEGHEIGMAGTGIGEKSEGEYSQHRVAVYKRQKE